MYTIYILFIMYTIHSANCFVRDAGVSFDIKGGLYTLRRYKWGGNWFLRM